MMWWFYLIQADNGWTDLAIFCSMSQNTEATGSVLPWGFQLLKPIQGPGYHIHSILGYSLWLISSKQKLHWDGQQRVLWMEGITRSAHQRLILSLRHSQSPEMSEEDDHEGNVVRIVKLASSRNRNRGSLMLLGQVTTLSWFALNNLQNRPVFFQKILRLGEMERPDR